MTDMQQLPEHVRRIIRRDDEVQFTPPSFERWLGRLQMLRTLASMGGFLLLWLVTYGAGLGWETATVRGIIAAIAFHFVAWALGLFVFGELYDVEIKSARVELETRERDRARRIEEYYRERLLAQGLLGQDSHSLTTGGSDTAVTETMPITPPTQLPSRHTERQQQRAA